MQCICEREFHTIVLQKALVLQKVFVGEVYLLVYNFTL